MSYILHLSDFHYAGDRDTLANRFSGLAEHLNERNIDVKYIVCTGDFLEQKLLINAFAKDYCDRNGLTCPSKSNPDQFRRDFLDLVGSLSDTLIQDYNNTLINSMKTAFSDFSQILKEFMRQVNVDSKHLVICCGNHDKTWILTDNKTLKGEACVVYNILTDTIELEKGGMPPADDERCYEAFDYFCGLLNLNYKHNTYLHSVDDDFEFLIVNSNYGKENREKLCVNCLSLNDYISKTRIHKFHSAVVMHAPFRSLCENFDMTFGTEENSSILFALLNSASLCMCGDKHTNDRRSLNGKPVFMSGEFAYDDTLKTAWNCRLISCDNTKEYLDSTVLFRDGRWRDNRGIKNAIEISLKYGNNDSIKKLIGDHKIANPATVLSSRKEEYLTAMSHIIKSVCNYKVVGTKDYLKFDEKTNLFDFLETRFLTMLDEFSTLGLDEQKGFHSLLKLIGNTGVGKSTFVYALWADALYKFAENNKPYLPLVFDFGKFRRNRPADVRKLWKDFLTESNNLSKALNVSIVCFIDGLYSFGLVPEIKKLLEYIMSSFNQYERLFYVISVEKHRGQHPLQNTILTLSEEVNWRGNDYMCINNVDVHKYEDVSPNEEMECSVRYSIELSDRSFSGPAEKDKCAKDAAEFLQKIGYAEVSLSTLRMIINSPLFDSWISTDKKARSKEEARKLFYTMLHDRWASDFANQKLARDAYRLSYGNVGKIGSIPDADRLILDAEYRNFLCSQHILHSFESDRGDKLSWETSHAVAILVRSAVNLKKYSQTTLSNKLSSIVDKSKGKESLILVYLIGTCLDHESRIELLNRVIEKHPLPSATEIDEFSYEDYKSITTHFFAKFLILFGSTGQSLILRTEIKKQFFDTLQTIIKEKSYMKYYRIFMLDYYGDLEHNRLTVSSAYKEEAKDIRNFEGYDFKRYFTSLAANIKEKTAEFPDEYIVLLLCDIVYSRLMESVKNPGEKYFFNSSVTRYNDQSNILKTTLECINTILNRKQPQNRILRKLKDNGDVYNLYYRYLTTMSAMLKDCQNAYNKFSSDSADDAFIEISKIINPAWSFECISDLKWQPRTGWYYKESPAECSASDEIRNHTQAIYEKNKKEYFPETIAEHCFECMLIAEMYLPDSIDVIKQFEKNHDTGGYDKTIVIRILLTYETGKSQVGDKPEQHINAKEKDEYYEELDTNMYRLMLHEVLSGYTSGDNLHFLQSKVKYAGGSHDYNYNEKLAKDIEIIQREYTRMKYASKLQFTEKRNENFEMSQQELNTGYGKELLRILVIDNPFLTND